MSIMAAVARKGLANGVNLVSRRTLHLTSSFAGVGKDMADPLEHATGLEKQELLAKAAGNDNPFDMRAYKRTSGTLSDPTLIPSFCDARIVGCVCQEDATKINWMWLAKGVPKRCECGFFFKLIDAKPMV